MRSQQIASRLSLLVSLLLLVNLSVFMGLTIPVHASSQNNTVAKMQPDLSFQKDLDVLLGHLEKSDSSDDSGGNDYFGLANDNPPDPTNPCYREYQLMTLNQKSIKVPLKAGKSLKGDVINLPNLIDKDLKELKNSDIEINSNSSLNQDDLATPLTFNYGYNSGYLSINLNDSGLDKANGAGTQLRLNLKSQDGKRSNQAVIGLWRNYVEHPYFELDIGNNLYLQYMLNNDSTYSDPKPSTEVEQAIPNYRISDLEKNKVVDTMYSGDRIVNDKIYDNLFILLNRYRLETEYRLEPQNHMYVGTDPKNPKKILFQFDASLVHGYWGEWNRKGIPRIRVMGCLEPAKNDQQEVITKQKLINYSTDVDFSNINFYRAYDTKLNNNDNVPIYIGEIDRASGRPKGIYFKNGDKYVNNEPYRLDFLFDGSNISEEFGAFGWHGFNDNLLPSDKNVNKVGYINDTNILSYTDSVIGMLWPFKSKWTVGVSTPTISYGVTSSVANAPDIRVPETLSYAHDPGKENPLPELPLEGKVNSTNTDCSEVKLYYSIDQKDLTKFRYLTTVRFEDNQHDIHSWEDFPQKGQKACITNNNGDLNTLATPSKNGHTIYIYGVDNSDWALKSHLKAIKVLPNIKIPLYYSYKKNSGETEKVTDDLLGAVGTKYNLNDVNDSHYLPRIINRNGINYQLDKSQSSSLAGIFNESTAKNGIKIVYQERESMLIMHAPKLDFGDVLLPTHKKLIPIKKQNNSNDQLEIIDINTGTPTWKLTMAATPFYRVDPHSGKEIKDDKDKLENLLTYQYANKDALVLKSSPQEIRRYSDAEVQNASTREGRQTTTDFRNIWWNGEQQIEGPMLQPPKNYSFKNKTHQVKYQSTVTWTLNNSL